MDVPVFYIVDVFAEGKFSGNQLAVFRFTKGLTDKQMQQIAQEMNFSETTFILSDEKQDGAYDVRIFTPKNEVPFAGHPTLGTAFVIKNEIEKTSVKEVVLNLKAGRIPVVFEGSKKQNQILWMRQLEPFFGETYNPAALAQILNLDPKEIDEGFPVQHVSTGLPTVVVPLKTLESVKRAKINDTKYLEFTKNITPKTILVFCPETYHKTNDLNVRFFAPRYGIPEDPATGSANGCLAGYLVKHNYFETEKIDLKVEQGYEINRPALLLLKAEKNQQKIIIKVGGKVQSIAKGKLV